MSDRKKTSGTRQGKEWQRTEGLERSLRKREDYSRTKKTEYAGVYDRDGNPIIEKHGQKGSVSFYPWEADRFEGATMTHNHPNDSCFSSADISTSEMTGLMEIRATTSTGKTYCLRRTKASDAKRGQPSALGGLYEREAESHMRTVIRPGFDADRARLGDKPIRRASETHEQYGARYTAWAKSYNGLVKKWNDRYNAHLSGWLRDNSKKYGWSYREEQK